MSAFPELKHEASVSIDGRMIWIHGEPKIGKTTFALGFPGVYLLASEKGYAAHDVWAKDVSSWREFDHAVAALVKEKPDTLPDGEPLKWVVIDTIDHVHAFCYRHVCREMGVADPSELSNGKGWTRLDDEFTKVMVALRSLPCGLICVSHSRDTKITIAGREITKVVPHIGAAGYRYCLRASDAILHMHSESVPVIEQGKMTDRMTDKRVLTCQPTRNIVAGGRFKDLLPARLPLDVQAFLGCFEQP